MECEIPKVNLSSTEIGDLLRLSKTIAVVGISPKEDRPSHTIAKYLMENGYRVFGVNPGLHELFGQPVYKSLLDVPEKIDIVDVFRPAEAVPEIVDQAIAVGAKSIWLQEGIVHNVAAQKAKDAGLQVVMSKCIYKEHAGRSL